MFNSWTSFSWLLFWMWSLLLWLATVLTVFLERCVFDVAHGKFEFYTHIHTGTHTIKMKMKNKIILKIIDTLRTLKLWLVRMATTIIFFALQYKLVLLLSINFDNIFEEFRHHFGESESVWAKSAAESQW